jgi:hypothetical protein
MPDRDLSSLSHIDPERLSRLWPQAGLSRAGNGDSAARPASGAPPKPAEVRWEPAELGDVLRHQLAASFELGNDANEQALRFTAEGAAGETPAPRPGTTLAALLSDPAPPVEALRRVKEWAKPAMQGCADDLPREVAGVIYFAAIHAALARAGGERITRLPDGTLRKGARWSLRRPWLDPLLVAVFREGLSHLAPVQEEAEGS